MSDIVERLEEQANTAFTFNITRQDVAEAAAEIKRLREELAGADEHAKRLEAVVEKMTVWEPSKGGRLG